MTSKGEHLRFYRLVPLFTEERDLEIRQGLAPLMNAFDKESTPFIVDVRRKNVAVKQHSVVARDKCICCML